MYFKISNCIKIIENCKLLIINSSPPTIRLLLWLWTSYSWLSLLSNILLLLSNWSYLLLLLLRLLLLLNLLCDGRLIVLRLSSSSYGGGGCCICIEVCLRHWQLSMRDVLLQVLIEWSCVLLRGIFLFLIRRKIFVQLKPTVVHGLPLFVPRLFQIFRRLLRGRTETLLIQLIDRLLSVIEKDSVAAPHVTYRLIQVIGFVHIKGLKGLFNLICSLLLLYLLLRFFPEVI